MTALAKKNGMACALGCTLPRIRAGMWDTVPGGVRILYRLGMVMQLVAHPANDEVTQAQWESSRWLHAYLAHAEGHNILNV